MNFLKSAFKLKNYYPEELIRRGLAGWILAIFVGYILLPAESRSLEKFSALKNISPVIILTVFLISFILMSLVSGQTYSKKLERYTFLGSFVLLSVLSLIYSFTPLYLLFIIVITGLMAIYCVRGANISKEKITFNTENKNEKNYRLFIIILSILFFLFVSVWTVARVIGFFAPTFDFGIFSQMFHSMKTTGLPITTLERDGALSHFNVHVSPIFYLLLPFYYIFPFPATLQILQAAVMASAVVPLYKISKHRGIAPYLRFLMCALLLLYPAFSGGAGYDIHENVFLTPLILWLFYGIEKRNIPVIAVFSLLALAVKEDAAVYVAIIALWLIIKGIVQHDLRESLTGLSLLFISVVWFLLATGYLANIGDGVMSYRYNNLIYDGSSSLLTVIKSVIIMPLKAIYECADVEKIKYIALTLLPLCALIFTTRRYDRYILFLPYILVNLMSDYQYQHNIFYQYSFGSIAFLIYLSILNLSDLKQEFKKRLFVLPSVFIAAILFLTNIVPVARQAPLSCIANMDKYKSIYLALEIIPDDATVAATTFYTVPLSEREIIYDIKYSKKAHVFSCDYIVCNPKSNSSYRPYAYGEKDAYENFKNELIKQGYVQISNVGTSLVIYEKLQK